MGDPSLLLWGTIFGGVGIGFFSYGKKQKSVVPLLTGLALFVFPYLISNVYVLVLVGLAIMAVPYVAKKLSI